MKNTLFEAMRSLPEKIMEKYITVQKHPTAELYIYNYSQKAQYDKAWDTLTLACRGLILDSEKNIVARPFCKFFNWEEHTAAEIPSSKFSVFEKMDGSLGILYFIGNQPFIATRGSFVSEQAVRATSILYKKYVNIFPLLDTTKTYLFEIIYPENRIVVDYGASEDLILLAVIATQTGEEEALPDIGFPLVKKYDGIADVATLKKMETANKEGFVLLFENSFRVKVKFQEYIRLHRIITQISTTDVWEYLKENRPMDELLTAVPDEFFDWVKQTVASLNADYQCIEAICKTNFMVLESRKLTAAYFQTQAHTQVLFLMLDNRNYEEAIWKIIQPVWSKPFSKLASG